MAKRKSLSDSIRWAVFARDGFCCRYCGKQAGEDGVTLAVDHIVSVADEIASSITPEEAAEFYGQTPKKGV